ncbi:branched-chain amino acid ABC transporter permease [Fuscibacter oryzae]|uniref:Branched-chain amino acid ABC transporter permease n=1 Tax=Fuscibacter oryzae TaxID=2803939 RepID=A0A8J7MSL7_9RHOB|nr:branched-chain amino acid ABC transporter permease [Fuscibacter oryzae]MBL4927668.1 branched-chain amino acid ABC transporter permease [Fuscibacter oryzae]
MSQYRTPILFGGVALLFILTGVLQSWNLSLSILTMGLLSAIMAMGVNMQWGYAGLFSTGIVGSVALGGLGVVLVAAKPAPEGLAAGGWGIVAALIFAAVGIVAAVLAWPRMKPGRMRAALLVVYLIVLFWVYRTILDPAVTAVEANDPTRAGNIGGLGWNAILGWPVGALFAGLAAWIIGKIALGLRTDYLAIATLGIAEIVLMVLKNEDWLARGVKNLGIESRPWPVPYEVDLQVAPWFLTIVQDWGLNPTTASTILVKLLYCGLFTLVLLALVWMSERALHSPWGRMMRAIRDNEVSAAAMGKNVTRRHLQIFIIGSAVVGLAGAMMTSMDGQISPGSYQPLRYTFLIWIMVIVGGSGNNWGSVLGGLLIGWLYLAVEFLGPGILRHVVSVLPFPVTEDSLKDISAHTRLITLGVVLLMVLRFSPKGLLPER